MFRDTDCRRKRLRDIATRGGSDSHIERQEGKLRHKTQRKTQRYRYLRGVLKTDSRV